MSWLGGSPRLVQVRAWGTLGLCGMTRGPPIGSGVRSRSVELRGVPPCWGQGLSQGWQPAGPDTSWRLPAWPEVPLPVPEAAQGTTQKDGPRAAPCPCLPSLPILLACGLVFNGSFVLS